MSKRSWLVLSTLLAAACGSKTQPAPSPAPVEDAASPPTTAAPTSAAPTAEADVATPPPTTAPPTTAPPTTEPPPTTAPPTAEADAVTPTEDVAPPPVEEVAPTAEVAEVPADLPKVPGMAPEVVARLLSGEEGCVGMGKSGRSVVSIISLGGTKTVRITDMATPDRGFGEVAMALPTRDTILTDELSAQAKTLRLVPCTTTAATGGNVIVPKSVPVNVTSSGGTITAQIEGNKALVIDATFGDVQFFEPAAAYWSDEIGNFYLRLKKAGADVDLNAAESWGTVQISATELGLSECVARPSEGKPLPTAAPAPFTANLSTPSCIAMTADGKQAAFRLFNTMPGESGPNTVQWFGEGTPPAVDLSCFARSCNAAQKAAAEEAAKAANLIACAEVKGGIALDGMVVPWMYQEDKLKLKTTTGWRVVHEFVIRAIEEGPSEKLWRQYQLPTGGPVFLYVGTAGDTDGESKANVLIIDESMMKLCEKAPAGTLKASEVKVVSAAPDGGGYKFGAMQLVDGDISSSWQPAAKKPNETAAPWVELVLPTESEVVAVEIANGFQRKDGNGDMFALNARAAEGTLTFSDGSTEKVAFGPDERGFKRFTLSAPKKTTSVKLTIDNLHDGSRWPKDLAISEIRLVGP